MTLEKKYYTSLSIFNKEIENIFFKRWLCIGRSNEIIKTGQYKIIYINEESFIVLKNENNELKAFYNVCRHRGTRICSKEDGFFSKSIQCPYHGWTYDLNGKLIGAPNMDAVEKFKKNNYALFSPHLKEWNGFIFLNLSDNPPDFESEYKSIINRFSEWGIKQLITIDYKTYNVNCNWKLIIQNYSECYHCPIIHKSLANITPYTRGRNDLTSGAFLGGFMEMNTESVTLDGKLSGISFENLSDNNLKRVYYYTLFPNMLLSLHPDYIMFHTVWPISPQKCQVNCSWLFLEEVKNNSYYQPMQAIKFWDQTNLEDWEICEKSQLGIGSSKYQPGPYSGQESLLAAFDRYYLYSLNKT